jgi:hypothetical protein
MEQVSKVYEVQILCFVWTENKPMEFYPSE